MPVTNARTPASKATRPPDAPPPETTDAPLNGAKGQKAAPAAKAAPPRPETAPPAELIRPMPSEADYWEWSSQFTAEQWSNSLIAYLYRNAPLHDVKLGNRNADTNIRKISEPFDIDWIKQKEGSGGYRIDLLYINPITNKASRIARVTFKILDLDYPPRMPYGVWLTWSENEAWKWAAPVLKAREQEAMGEAAATTQANNGQQNQTELFKMGLDAAREMRGDRPDNNDLVIQVMQKNQDLLMTSLDPMKQFATFKNLLADSRPAEASTKPYELMLEMQREQMKDLREEMRELRAAHQAPQQDILTTLLNNAPKVKEIASLFGLGAAVAGATSEAGLWVQVADKLADKLGDNIPLIVGAFQNRNGASPDPWKPQQQQQGQAAPPPAVQGASQPQPQPQQQAAAPAATTEEKRMQQERARLEIHITRWGSLFSNVAQHMIDHFSNKETGYDFRDWFLDRHGRNTWSQLREELSARADGQPCPAAEAIETAAARLCGMTQMHAYLKAKCAPIEEFNRFAQEFFTVVGEEPPGVVQPDDDATPPASGMTIPN